MEIKEQTVGGVRCDIITPLNPPAAKRDRVLINVHGGGFNSDSGSLVEGIPIANLTAITVVSVYYRLAPEFPFPAAVDDTEAVYKELLKTHKPEKIGLFGTSAGAILTAEVAVQAAARRPAASWRPRHLLRYRRHEPGGRLPGFLQCARARRKSDSSDGDAAQF